MKYVNWLGKFRLCITLFNVKKCFERVQEKFVKKCRNARAKNWFDEMAP